MRDGWLAGSVLRTSIAVCGVALNLCTGARAQQASGDVEGRVVSGASVVSATVVLSCALLPGSRSQATDERGRFRFRSLPPGTCELLINAPGYAPLRITNVIVSLGRATSIGDANVEPTAIRLPEVVVVARGTLDPKSPSFTTNMHERDLVSLPNGRTFGDALILAPQSDASYLPGEGVNVASGTGPETAYYIDGVNVTEVSLGTSGIAVPLNFIDEMQVTSGGFTVGTAAATGGVINVGTRSGGNRFRGALFGYFAGHPMSQEPRFPSVSLREERHRSIDFGGWVSGPIASDRAFFFLGYNLAFDQQRVALTDLPAVTVRRHTHAFAGKLGWRVTRRADVSISLLGDPGVRESIDPFFPGASVANVDAVLSKGGTGGTVISGQMRLTAGTSGQVQLSVSRQQRADHVQPETVRGRTEPLLLDVPANTLSGGTGIATRAGTARTSVTTGLTLTAGTHVFNGGAEYEHNAYDFTLTYGLGPDRYQGAVLRLDDSTYQWVRGYDAGVVANRVTAAFVEDAWTMSERVTMVGGLRLTDQRLLSSSGQVMQRFSGAWQPRVGIVLLPGDRGTQRVTVSVGRVYETFPANIARLYQQSRRQLITQYDHDPRLDSTRADTIYAVLSPSLLPGADLDGQSVDDLAAAYDRLIGKWTVGVRVHHRRLRSAVEDTFDPVTGELIIGNPGRGRLSFLPRPRREYTALILSASGQVGPHLNVRGSYVLSRVYGNYEGLYDYAQLEPFPNTTAQLDSPEQVPNSTGPLPNDRTHAVKVVAIFDARRGWVLGTTAMLVTGTPRNELGASTFGFPYFIFLQPRGSAGRAPTVVDVALRGSWIVPGTGSMTLKVVADAYHLGNQRATVRYDDARYLAQDGSGNQIIPNPNYGRGVAFVPPFHMRIGLMAEF